MPTEPLALSEKASQQLVKKTGECSAMPSAGSQEITKEWLVYELLAKLEWGNPRRQAIQYETSYILQTP